MKSIIKGTTVLMLAYSSGYLIKTSIVDDKNILFFFGMIMNVIASIIYFNWEV